MWLLILCPAFQQQRLPNTLGAFWKADFCWLELALGRIECQAFSWAVSAPEYCCVTCLWCWDGLWFCDWYFSSSIPGPTVIFRWFTSCPISTLPVSSFSAMQHWWLGHKYCLVWGSALCVVSCLGTSLAALCYMTLFVATKNVFRRCQMSPMGPQNSLNSQRRSTVSYSVPKQCCPLSRIQLWPTC